MNARWLGLGLALSLLGCSQDAILGITASYVTVVQVTPAADTLTTIGETRQLVALAKDQSGLVLNGVKIFWSSSNAGVVSVDASGMATARANGRATITASVGVTTGTAVLTVAEREH
jgi:hypothetical protein